MHKQQSFPRLEHLEPRIALSTFHVNTTLDTVAVNLRTGKDAAGHISLRSAIMAADAKGGATRSSSAAASTSLPSRAQAKTRAPPATSTSPPT